MESEQLVTSSLTPLQALNGDATPQEPTNAENIKDKALTSKPHIEMTAEELISRGTAPIKKEYMVPKEAVVSDKQPLKKSENDETNALNSKVDDNAKVENKSKRQLKRERFAATKLKVNFCGAIARTGDLNSCPYKDSCRYSHDIKAFLESKVPDLPGDCPYLGNKNGCPYGISCRFYGTHGKKDGVEIKEEIGKEFEINGLTKEFQKKFWKNELKTPKADQVLKTMGLLNKNKDRPKKPSNEEPENEENQEKSQEQEMEKRKPEITETKEENPSKKTKTSEISPGKAPETLLVEENKYSGGDLVGGDPELALPPREKTRVDFKGKLYVAPLTTVGNLPFRRLCVELGADVTCGEMALCSNLMQGQASEWALLRRHVSEKVFGVQICGAYPDQLARVAEVVDQSCKVDFIDINMGCPIDLVVNKGAGSALLMRPTRMEQCVRATSASIDTPLTIKVRTSFSEGRPMVHSIIPVVEKWGIGALTLHGRTRQQRYSKTADWNYIQQCASLRGDQGKLQIIGNGDIMDYMDWNKRIEESGVDTCMLARGVLIKPWLLTEIKEQRRWDISAGERLELLKKYTNYGLTHWGSDTKGVETTRRFLLEWLSYLHRYIPVGLLEVLPQKLNWRPPKYYGRSDLESLLSSESVADWVRISEMLLGPAPNDFSFTPKHKSNSYDKAENG